MRTCFSPIRFNSAKNSSRDHVFMMGFLGCSGPQHSTSLPRNCYKRITPLGRCCSGFRPLIHFGSGIHQMQLACLLGRVLINPDLLSADLLKSAYPSRAGARADIPARRSCAKSGCEQSQHGNPLFDHLVGAAEQRKRNGEAERFGSLEVDDQLDFGDLLDRHFGRFLAPENPAGINTDPTVQSLVLLP